MPVRLYGHNVPFGATPNYQRIGGYALTRNVSRDFMDAWIAQNKDSDLVVNGMVFINPTDADARDEAKEKRDIKSGLEPLKPDGDKRVPRRKGGLELKTADEQSAKFAEEAEA